VEIKMSKKKVLIVEDEGIVALDLKSRLEKWGYEVAELASSGEEALRIAEKERPDLVLMDIVLAGKMNGIDAAARIRERVDTPVIYLTAYTDGATLQRAKSTTPYGYIVKPFQERELECNIEIALYKHAAEKKIKENQAWLAMTLKSIGEGVIATDPKGQISFLNPAAESLTGWMEKEALGESLKAVFRTLDEDTGKEAEDPARNALEGEIQPGFSDHTLLVDRHGARRSIAQISAPIKDDRGNILGAIVAFRDITGRKQAEQDLCRSEERYRMVADYTYDWEYWLGPDWNFTYVSPSCERVTGYPREAFLQDPGLLRKTIHPRDLPSFLSHEKEVRKGEGAARRAEFRIIRRDGRIRWVEHVCQRVFGREGNFLGVRASNRDVTDRRLAEEGLRKSEERFRLLYQSLPLGYQSLDPEGRFIEINQVWLDETGYARGEVIGRPFAEFLTPSSRDLFRKRFPVLLASGEVHGCEFDLVRKDGSVLTVSVDGRVGYDEKGRFKQTHCIMTNVTERKKGEEALRRSEEKYRTLVESGSDAIFIVQDDTLKFANRKTQTLFGYTAEELARIPVVELFHADERKILLERRQKRLRGEEVPSRFTFRAVTKSGRQVWIELNAVSIEWEGRPARLNFARDITEQKQLEERFLQAQKMEAIGLLAGGIAHDFNNALTLISVCSQMALIELDQDSPVREKIETIYASTERSANLAQQLLAFSRRQVMELKVLDLNLVLRDLEKMLRRLIGENIGLNLSLDEDLGVIKGDPGQIEHVILNLAVNARDALADGGALTLETRNVELGPDHMKKHPEIVPGRYVQLAVSDTGIGMTPEVARRIFEPFFTTKERGKGTGLGLSTVYGVVKQSGGYIYAESRPGEGATFRIYLPRVDEELIKEEPWVRSEENLPRGGESVFVVEDEEPIRLFVAQILRKQGYDVTEASGSGEALLKVEKLKKAVELLLADVVMPGMNGPELAERLRGIHPRMKVLYMSGYPDETIASQGVLKEGVNFLQKPFTLERLLAKVRQVLDAGPAPSSGEQISLL
jgi:two-component system cell cycle sensor histidine kinase/response regulator CckA